MKNTIIIKLTPRWFYKGLLDQLGLESKYYRGDAKRQLQKEIEIIRGVHGQKVVCVLDEAHLLEKETIEGFRFLLNYKFDSESPMALVRVGQSELWKDKLRLRTQWGQAPLNFYKERKVANKNFYYEQ